VRVLDLEALAARRGDASAVVGAGGAISYAALAERVTARAAEMRRDTSRGGARSLLRCRRDLATIVDALALLALERAVLPCSDAATPDECAALAAAFDATPSGAAIALPSSGSTGAPKLVLKSAAQIRAAMEIFARSVALDSSDRVMALVPFEHTYGFVCVLLGTLARGGAIVLPAAGDPRETPHPRAILETIRRNEATLFPASAQFFDLLVRFEKASDAEGAAARLPLRAAISVGSALARRVHAAFTEAFDVPLWQSYGASEAGPVCLNTTGVADGELLALGAPCEGVEVSIRASGGAPREEVGGPYECADSGGSAIRAEDDRDDEADDRGPCADGEEGEIVVRSPAVGIGYAGAHGVVDRVGESRIASGGVFFTGDLGRREHGTIFFSGRRKLFISVSGRKVDPYEVEEVLRAHPRVADAAVTAHASAGHEVVKAIVVPRGPLDPVDAIDHCARWLAAHKVPRVIELREALPRNELGKLQRDRL
jgi:acyl-CoA synthetase (AMP-forming)/AMP-acid ligase II